MPCRVTVEADRYGERWAMLLDERGMPLFYPTLFATTKLRLAGRSTATQAQYLTAVKVLIEYCERERIDLVTRIRSTRFLSVGELDGLSYACRARKRPAVKDCTPLLRARRKAKDMYVDRSTHYIYLRCIAKYLKWLSEVLLSTVRYTPDVSRSIQALSESICARAVIGVPQLGDDDATRGLTSAEELELIRVVTPGNKDNPFSDAGVQVRNYVIIKLLLVTGMRGGELLNTRVGDIDWQRGQLNVIRRADSKSDLRPRQPLVKTRQRAIPLMSETMAELRSYIVDVRKRVPNSAFHPYLFVVHKSGPTQGWPLSLSSLQEMFGRVRAVHPTVRATPHDLRHRWHWRYSDAMKRQKLIGDVEAEQLRNLLAGWSPSSKMGARYNKLFIQEQAHAAIREIARLQAKDLGLMEEENAADE